MFGGGRETAIRHQVLRVEVDGVILIGRSADVAAEVRDFTRARRIISGQSRCGCGNYRNTMEEMLGDAGPSAGAAGRAVSVSLCHDRRPI